MATAPTLIGPVGTRQINRNFYVGMADLTTIQKAVTVAVAIGSGCVIIPAGYAGSDTIASITGGNASVYLSDQRTAQAQNYVWSGSAYTPADFVQAQGYVTKGMPTVPQGSAALSYNPAGTTGIGTATLYIAAMPGMGIPSFNLTGMSSNGTGNQTYLRAEISPAGAVPVAGIPQIEMPSQLGLFNDGFNHYNLWAGMAYLPGGKGMTIWAKPTENAIDLQGSTIGGAYDQTVRLNHLGGNVQIGPITFSPIGDITGVGDIAAASIAADDADFDTCEVGNSPVRTFANTPDGPGQGMVWPTDGIPVSLGDHWQNPSIDPATVATWPPAGIAVSTGTAWGTSISPASLATWPAAGIPVSTGTAWGASVDTANVAMRNLANIFTQPNSFSFNANGSTTVTVQGGLQIAWNVGNGSGETDFINIHSAVGGGFYWYNVAPGTTLTSATPKAMSLDSSNGLNVAGNTTIVGDAIARSVHCLGGLSTGTVPNSVWMDFQASSSLGRIVTTGPSTGTLVGLAISGVDGTGGTPTTYGTFSAVGLSVNGIGFFTRVLIAGTSPQPTSISANYSAYLYNDSTTPTITKLLGFGDGGTRGVVDIAGMGGAAITYTRFARFSDSGTTVDGTLTCNALTTKSVSAILTGVTNLGFQGDIGYLDCFGAAGARGQFKLRIGSASAANILNALSIDASGNATVYGTLTASGKSFRIPHPLDDSKDLVHACMEGPEWGVYYRGEGATAGGWAEITLPDYFEALTKPDERTILITPLFEDEAEQVGMVAASRVYEGKFKVWSSLPAQKFYWEVKATRSDKDSLEIEPLRIEQPAFKWENGDNDADANGNGTPEAGEPNPTPSPDATTGATDTNRKKRVH